MCGLNQAQRAPLPEVVHDGEEVEQPVMVEVESPLEGSLAQKAQYDSIKAGIYIVFVTGIYIAFVTGAGLSYIRAHTMIQAQKKEMALIIH